MKHMTVLQSIVKTSTGRIVFDSVARQFSEKYFSHGNNMAYFLKIIGNHVNTKGIDRATGVDQHTFYNTNICRGLKFTYISTHDPYGNKTKLPEAWIPVLGIYNRAKILCKNDVEKYYERNSNKKIVRPVEWFHDVMEYAIPDKRANRIKPDYLFVGYPFQEGIASKRKVIDMCNRLEDMYNRTVYLVDGAILGLSGDERYSFEGRRSTVALAIMQFILHGATSLALVQG